MVAKLEALEAKALTNNQLSAGVSAVMGMAKILGFLSDKTEISGSLSQPASDGVIRYQLIPHGVYLKADGTQMFPDPEILRELGYDDPQYDN